MIDSTEFLIGQVVVATCMVAFSSSLILLLCKLIPAVSQRTRVLAWFLVLAQGCLLFIIPVELPWLEPEVVQVQDIGFVVSGEPINSESFESTTAVGSEKQEFFSLTIWLALIWSVGVLIALLLPVVHYLRLASWVRQLPTVEANAASELTNLVASIGKPISIQKCRLVKSQKTGPFVCRTNGQYAIVVPERFWNSLERSQRRAILNHELTHILRLDLWKITLARILVSVQWFNPLAWLALKKFVVAIELACDEQAKGESPQQQLDYSRALLAMVELSSPKTPKLLLADANHSPLYQRIEYVLKPKGNEMKMTRMFIATLLLMIMLAGVLRVQLVAQEASTAEGPLPKSETVKQDESRRAGSGAEQETEEAVEEVQLAVSYSVADLVVGPTALGITERDFQPLMEMIQETIDPGSWESNGGKGRIQPFPANLSLITTQTAENHERIQDLLKRVRELNIPTLSVDGELLVMSRDDVSKFNVDLVDDGGTLLGEEDADGLVSLAEQESSSESFDLPPLSFQNGQTIQYRPPYIAGVREYGGVDFSNIRMQGSKWASQDIVRLSIFGELVGSDEDYKGNPIARYKGIWTESIPAGGFIAVEVSDKLIDKESNKRAFLVLKANVHSWK